MSNWNRNNRNFSNNIYQTPRKIESTNLYSYDGFKLYFHDENVEDVPKALKITATFAKFIEATATKYDYETIEKKHAFIVDYKQMETDENLTEKWPEFKSDLTNETDLCLNCMGLAMHQHIINDYKSKQNDEHNLAGIKARLINYEPFIALKDLRVSYFNKLVSVRGTVIRAGHVNLVCKSMAYQCELCLGVQVVPQIDGCFTLTNKCVTSGCRAQSNFKPLHCSAYTKTVKMQTIKIQELVGIEKFENGRIPRILVCELAEDLVESCIPGDDVTLVGVIKVLQSPESSYPNKAKHSAVFSMYLDTISLVNNKSESDGAYGASERITFNMKDYYAIQQIHAETNLFRFLIQSLCPTIYGHEIVKAGLLLALFGGTKSALYRSESHILLVGDPGLGKSQMLQACTNVAPRGVYVCGTTSTNSGLTVTVSRETGGEYFLEAGALLLADQGCCCIDEFDKMLSQHACLLEAMEQQSISVAKAGIVCTLPTRATILAAANPAGGHYNKAKTISENLRISSPMLSRFDLIFILLDNADEEMDRELSRHVLNVHSSDKNKNTSFTSYKSINDSNNSILEKLQMNESEHIDHLPHTLFRKYIAYAQRYVNPQLNDEAKTVLKNYYQNLRKQFKTGDCTPVTTRQLSSLIRLTQARAKIELREEALESDALDVIEIMKYCLSEVFTNECGVMDTTRSSMGTGMSKQKQALQLFEAMQRQSELQCKSVFTLAEIREIAQKINIPTDKVYNLVDGLNLQGFLLNKGHRNYQLISA